MSFAIFKGPERKKKSLVIYLSPSFFISENLDSLINGRPRAINNAMQNNKSHVKNAWQNITCLLCLFKFCLKIEKEKKCTTFPLF